MKEYAHFVWKRWCIIYNFFLLHLLLLLRLVGLHCSNIERSLESIRNSGSSNISSTSSHPLQSLPWPTTIPAVHPHARPKIQQQNVIFQFSFVNSFTFIMKLLYSVYVSYALKRRRRRKKWAIPPCSLYVLVLYVYIMIDEHILFNFPTEATLVLI